VTPVVTTSTANLAGNATQITITGFGFDPNAANDTVTSSNGAIGTVTAASPTSLTVKFATPPTAGSLTAVVTTDGVSSGAAVPIANVTPVQTSSTATPVASAPSTIIPASVVNPTTSGAPAISAPRHLTAQHGVVALHSIRITPGSGSDNSLLKVQVTARGGKFRIHAAKGHSAARTANSVTLTGNAATVNGAINRLVFVPNSAKSGGSITIVASAGTHSSQATITITKPRSGHGSGSHSAS
jgi:hypothetical protein